MCTRVAPLMALLVTWVGLPATVDAYRPSSTQKKRAYVESFIGLGGAAGLSPALELGGVASGHFGLGFHVAQRVGVTATGALLAPPDRVVGSADEQSSAPGGRAALTLDLEWMPRARQVEPYSIVGAALVSGTEESPGSFPAARLGAGVDYWVSEGKKGPNWWSALVLGARAVYMPSFGWSGGSVPIRNEVLIDLHLKLHLRFVGNLGTAGM